MNNEAVQPSALASAPKRFPIKLGRGDPSSQVLDDLSYHKVFEAEVCLNIAAICVLVLKA